MGKNTPEYNKKYYEKMKVIRTEIRLSREAETVLERLNNGGYKNIPHAKIKKHNIILNPYTKKYMFFPKETVTAEVTVPTEETNITEA
jgi:hypothetical protein